jgi:protein SCO1/2
MTFPLERRILLAFLLLAGSAVSPLHAEPLPDHGTVGDFAFTEPDGKKVTNEDLLGKVWVASFVFTRCTGGCPQVSKTVQRLHKDLTAYPDIHFVTFTVDPEHDTPKVLAKYASDLGANPERWLFLTGKEADIYKLMHDSFHLHAEQNKGKERTPGNEVAHDTKLVLVDQAGHIRGYYDGMPDKRLPTAEAEKEHHTTIRKLERDATSLTQPHAWYLPEDFPRFNATLNALAFALLLLGFGAVRRRQFTFHKVCMLTALFVSAVFLTSYLYYHLAIKHGQPTYFSEQAVGAPAWMSYVYHTILISHTVLAVVVAPLALYVAYLGLRDRFKRHAALARWTLPLWLYVSFTGVVVYVLLYRLYPSP